jgi:hypothetical protein
MNGCRRIGVIIGWAIVLSAATERLAKAQAPRPAIATETDSGPPVLRADPAELGLKLPDGDPLAGGERRVLVKSDDDELVVAKVVVEVGDALAVIMPDGRITAVPTRDATVTDRPFVGITSADLKAKLVKKFPGFKVEATKHFIYVYNSSEKFYKGTSGILESMYPGLVSYLKYRKIAVTEPDYPLVVIMFQTRKAWEDYMHGMFANTGIAAFYDGVSNRVLMYEQSELADLAPELALKECISTVAHEGVHQILHNIGVQQRLSRWPMWISEGLPEYFAPTSIGAGLKWIGAGQVNNLRMRSMADNIKTGQRPAGSGTLGSLTEWVIAADKIDGDGYAWSWALTHFLGEKRREPFQRYLTDVAKFEPLKPLNATARKELFIKHFGDDFKKLDADLLAHLYKLPYVDPIENMTHYVVMLDIAGQRMCQMTTSRKHIEELQNSLLTQIPPQERRNVQFRVQPFPNRTQARAFGTAWISGR